MADPNLLQAIAQAIGGWFQTRSQPKFQTSETGESNPSQSTAAFVTDQLKLDRDRQSRLKDFERMDDESVIVSSVLDIYADVATKGTTDKAATEVFAIQIDDKTDKNLRSQAEAIIQRLDETVRPKEGIWSIARESCKYGDGYEEIVVDAGGAVSKIQSLPAITMAVKQKMQLPGEQGSLLVPFAQKIDLKEPTLFDDWQIAQFKMAAQKDLPYGRSILHPSRRLFRQLQMIEDGMVIGRLVRSHQRYAFTVGTGDLTPKEKLDYVDELKKRHTKKRVIDPRTGTLKLENNPLTAEEDIWLPENSSVAVLAGSGNLGSVEDVTYLLNNFFAAFKVPKAYLGFEGDTRARKVITHLDIQFARSIRRVQYFLTIGLFKLYDVAFALAGIPPGSITYKVVFPNIGTEDEELRYTIMQAHASVTQSLNFMGVKFKAQWLLKEIMGIPDNQIEQALDLSAETQQAAQDMAGGAPNPNSPDQLQAQLKKMMGVEAREAIAGLRELLDHELASRGTPREETPLRTNRYAPHRNDRIWLPERYQQRSRTITEHRHRPRLIA